MIELSSGALEWLIVGGLLTIAGALVRFGGWTFLLAGYDETTPVPDDVVQAVAGNTTLRIGITLVVVGILTSVSTPPTALYFLVGAVIVLDVLRMLYRVNTWSTQAS